MSQPMVVRDERTVMVENSSYRLAYLVVCYGLLAVIAYRGYALRESSWDLMALVVGSGVVTTVYQGAHKILSRRWAALVLSSVLCAALLAAAIALRGRG